MSLNNRVFRQMVFSSEFTSDVSLVSSQVLVLMGNDLALLQLLVRRLGHQRLELELQESEHSSQS